MNFNKNNLSVLAYANNFTLWHYRTTDTSVTTAGYFNLKCDMFRINDLLIVTTDTSANPVTKFFIVTDNTNGVVTVDDFFSHNEMTKKPDGGSAFPENVHLCPNHNQVYPASEFGAAQGMTLRDWYAGMALQGLLAHYGTPNKEIQYTNSEGHGGTKSVTILHQDTAFRIADAMIEERGRHD